MRTSRKLQVAAALFLGLIAGAAAATEEGLQQLLDNARYWEDKGRADLARAALEKRLRVDPDSAMVFYQLGMTGIRMGEAQRCIDVVRRMRARLPGHELTQALTQECRVATQLRVEMATLKILIDDDRFAEAFKTMQKMFPEGPPPGRLGLKYQSIAKQAKRGYRIDIPTLSGYARRHPEDIDFQLQYADILASNSASAQAAIHTLKRVMRRPNIDRESALEVWRSALNRLGPERVNERMLADYLRYDPQNQQVRSLRDQRYLQTSREAAGIAIRGDGQPSMELINRLRTAVRRFPADPWLRYDLVRLLLRRGLQNEAIGHLRVGVLTAPDDSDMKLVAANIYEQLGMGRQALSELQNFVDRTADADVASRLLRLKAVQNINRGNLAAAQSAYEELLQLGGARVADYRDLADLFVARGNSDEGVATLERGVSRFPEDVWLRFTLAREYLERGQKQRAVDLMIQGLDASGGGAAALYALALIQDGADLPLSALQSLASIPEGQREDSHRSMLTRLRFERCIELAEDPESLAYCSGYAENQWERHRRLAMRLHRMGGTRYAWQSFNSWADDQPHSASGLLTRLELALDMGLEPEAKALLETLRPMVAQSRIMEGGRGSENQRRLAAARVRWLSAGGRGSVSTKQLDQGILDLQELCEDEAATAAQLRVLSEALRRQQRLQESLAWQKRLLQKGDVRESDYLQYVDSLIDSGNANAAERVLEARWAQSSGEDGSRIDLIRRWRQVDPAEARARLAVLVEEERESAAAMVEVARYFEDIGSYAQAEETYLRVSQAEVDTPLRVAAEQGINRIHQRRFRWVALGGDFVTVPGVPGISEIDRRHASLELQFAPNWTESAFVKVDPTVMSAGRFSRASGDEYAQLATVSPQQLDSLPLESNKRSEGVALGVGLAGRHWAVDLGVTPLGFEREQWVGGLSYSSVWKGHNYTVGVSRRAETSTYLSYVGDRDPISGEFWGAPLLEGVQLDLSRYEARFSYYLSADWHRVNGTNMPDNRGLISRTGADWKLIDRPNFEAFIGVAINYWAYSKNQRFYTFGHGGYYSPQHYLNYALPIEIRGLLSPSWSYQVLARAGHTRAREDGADFFPGRPNLQQMAIDQGRTPQFSGGSGNGNNFSWRVSSEYEFTDRWVFGLSYSQDRSAFFEPDFLQIYLRRSFAFSRDPLFVPPRPVRPYHQ